MFNKFFTTTLKKNPLKILLICFYTFYSCSDKVKTNPPKPKKISPVTEQPSKLKENLNIEENKITNSNVVTVLTAFGKENIETKVLIKTRFGDMKIVLYDKTPLHRANFLMLVKKNYYTGTVFYRVVKDFIIQGGNTDQEETVLKRSLIGEYQIPNEINQKRFHKKGALASARGYDNNPNKISDPFNFYIVHGEKLSDQYLDTIESRNNYKFTPYQRNIYKTLGGTPHLDGEHTVFGEVIEGLKVIDKIANVKTDNIEWPINEIVMDVQVINE